MCPSRSKRQLQDNGDKFLITLWGGGKEVLVFNSSGNIGPIKAVGQCLHFTFPNITTGTVPISGHFLDTGHWNVIIFFSQ